MAAFIGAGSLAERMAALLSVSDSTTLLPGALPAAVPASAVHWEFDLLERRWPRPVEHGDSGAPWPITFPD